MRYLKTIWLAVKQVMYIIYKKTGVRYKICILYDAHKWGFSAKVPKKRLMNTASKEEKDTFKRGTKITLANPKRIHNSGTG